MDSLTHDERMTLALSELSKQTNPNILGTSKKYLVNRTTLRRHFNGTQRSRTQFLSESHQCLSNREERVVIDFINRHTERFLPPTSQLVHNVAVEQCGRPINKNWVAMFTARHRDELHSDFWDTIDNTQVKAENIPLIERFYDQVSISKVLIKVLLLIR
jgi:hypothetical protein